MENTLILEDIATCYKPENKELIEGPLSNFINSKKSWDPFELPSKTEDPITKAMGTHKAIQKCLALALALELPVGFLALEGSNEVYVATRGEKGFDSMQYALEDNAHDEETHFKAFEFASVAYGMPQEYLDLVQTFRDQALAMEEHPVLMAGFLELSVFFPSLAIMRKWGSPSLKSLVNYVSRDESCHVNVNYHIVDSLGLTFNDYGKATELRESIIRWLTSDLTNLKEKTEYWLKVSSDLANTRKAPDLAWTKTPQMRAFFESANYTGIGAIIGLSLLCAA